MSRTVSLGTRPSSSTPGIGSVSSSLGSMTVEDMCPICKTSRYINKDLEFLINPECYHPMCSSCVNRLFNDAPAQCPTAGCYKTLRRKGFRSAFFGDLGVEREVDIRRRVAAVFNQTEDDFDTLRNYNDYLQTVEDLTFALVHGSDAARREAEARLAQWEIEHRADIERNRKAGREADELSRRRINAEREAARQRRLDAVRELEEEKRARVRDREAELDSLARGSGAEVTKVQLKRRGQAAASSSAAAALAAAATTAATADADVDNKAADTAAAAAAVADVGRLSIRGLKEKRRPREPEGPYDAFGGLDLAPSRYRVHPDLVNPWETDARLDSTILVGGYSFAEYTARAMFEAFAGLGVFVDDEKEAGVGLSTREVATLGAAMAAAGGAGGNNNNNNNNNNSDNGGGNGGIVRMEVDETPA